jgi:hypothetical protein
MSHKEVKEEMFCVSERRSHIPETLILNNGSGFEDVTIFKIRDEEEERKEEILKDLVYTQVQAAKRAKKKRG